MKNFLLMAKIIRTQGDTIDFEQEIQFRIFQGYRITSRSITHYEHTTEYVSMERP